MTAGRYARQMAVPGVGAAGQARLGAARVLVAGAGGLGCPVLATLAGAGVGRIAIVDHDTVEEGNLHRQPLYAMADLGRRKAEAARAALLARNPGIDVTAHAERLTPDNAAGLAAAADLVIDAADSFAVTYALSDLCRARAIPFVSASASGLGGHAGAFCGGGPSYRAVFPEPPATAADCAGGGVLGSVVAVAAGLQAQIALALLLGLAPSPLGTLASFDARTLRVATFSFGDAPEPKDEVPFLGPAQVGAEDIVIDLRAEGEMPPCPFPQALRLGPAALEDLDAGAFEGRRVVLCCRSGLRAAAAARRLRARGIGPLALAALG